MNKIFKTKWNVSTQSYSVCSELAKRAGKTITLGAATCSILLSLPAFAETINKPETTGEEIAKYITGAVSPINGLNITMTPKAAHSAKPKGILAHAQTDTEISNVNIDIKFASLDPTAGNTADSNASYGMAVGYDAHWLRGASTDTTKLTLNNADIKVANTEDTIYGTYRSVLPNVGHQLSGIRVYRSQGATPELISNGNLNITVTDNSSAKVGDYINGIYISGNGASATLNGTTSIKLVSEANGINSAGIKIGKPLDNGVNTGVTGATVTSNGKLVIDTTAAKNTAGVRLFDNDSKFIITGSNTNEASEIKASSSAIVFDTQDYVLGAHDVALSPSRNSNGQNQQVKLTDTVLSTTSDTASLIKARAQSNNSFEVTMAGLFGVNLTGKLNTGSFTTSGEFILSGEQSLATAARGGYLFEAEEGSTLAAIIKDKAKIVGALTKNTNGNLTIRMEDGAKHLLKKRNSLTRASDADTAVSGATSYTLTGGSELDVSEITTRDQTELDEAVQAAQLAFNAQTRNVNNAQTDVTNAENALTAANNLTQNPGETTTAYNTRKQRAIRNANTALTRARTALTNAQNALADAQTALNTANAEQAAGPLNAAYYTLRLRDSGNMSTLTNDSSTITLANNSYNDVFTIDG
ncbi:MAG: ESPR-type extended signal peptide-containing protein, partial [Lonepinella koalarum]|nr:ESPR-type extended signal peptide-containing protein [Lonepinella koalarum]